MTRDDERWHAVGGSTPTDEIPMATVEACGLLCPLPLVKTARALALLPAGALVELRCDDPAALVDVPEWCAARRHSYIGVCLADSGARTLRFFLRKG